MDAVRTEIRHVWPGVCTVINVKIHLSLPHVPNWYWLYFNMAPYCHVKFMHKMLHPIMCNQFTTMVTVTVSWAGPGVFGQCML